jgi:hypothetical protein
VGWFKCESQENNRLFQRLLGLPLQVRTPLVRTPVKSVCHDISVYELLMFGNVSLYLCCAVGGNGILAAAVTRRLSR